MGTEDSEKTGVTTAMEPAPEHPDLSMDGDLDGGRSDAADISLDESCGEQELTEVIEALLFVSRDPLTLDKLTTVLAGPPKTAVHHAVKTLQSSYDQEGRGLHIAELAGGYVMMTQPDCAPWITKLNTVKASAKVSRSALETLAIIAYRQPIVRAEIEQLRGVETSGVLRTLLDHKLIRIVGRKDIPGRPMMYGTSKAFLQKFGLRDLRDLPPLREFKELGQGDNADLLEEALASNGKNDNQETDVDVMTGDAHQDAPEPVAGRLNSSIA